MRCACAKPKSNAHARIIWSCACAYHLGVRMHISFWPAHAHLISACACTSLFGLRTRISFWPAHAHLISGCSCASHFELRMHISSRAAHAHLILSYASYIYVNVGTHRPKFRPNLFQQFVKHALLTLLKKSIVGLVLQI